MSTFEKNTAVEEHLCEITNYQKTVLSSNIQTSFVNNITVKPRSFYMHFLLDKG